MKKGETLNPGGRPVGALTKMSKSLVNKLARDFEQHGEQAICELREKDPGKYLTIIAGLLPKDVTLNVGGALDRLTDEQLVVLAGLIERASQDGGEAGAGEAVIEGEFSEVRPVGVDGAGTGGAP